MISALHIAMTFLAASLTQRLSDSLRNISQWRTARILLMFYLIIIVSFVTKGLVICIIRLKVGPELPTAQRSLSVLPSHWLHEAGDWNLLWTCAPTLYWVTSPLSEMVDSHLPGAAQVNGAKPKKYIYIKRKEVPYKAKKEMSRCYWLSRDFVSQSSEP